MSSLSIAAPERRTRNNLDCRVAAGDVERAAHFAIRRAVFCEEQRIFTGDDRDERDADAATLHVIGLEDGAAGGTVRLHPLDGAGLWQGDRLAVLRAHRHSWLGATLVRFAVRTAGERGGTRMVAMIQVPNVGFFEALGWRCEGDVHTFHGRRHQPMAIGLTAAG